MNEIIPIPRIDVNIRPATPGDLPFIDSLQKQFGKNLGFQATSWIESRIAKDEVLIADGAGYIIFQDKYLKREELGLVVQLCVDPAKQRGLIGAMLVKAAFERAAYGCRLFCLWCAQDLEANRFWESIGFVPLAYRGGSEKTMGGRVHIFWQKRIREGDTTTPWWFPAKTEGGAMRADRIVLPIPLGKHWSDELPVLQIDPSPVSQETRALPGETRSAPVPGTQCGPQAPTPKPRPHVQFGLPSAKPPVIENPAPSAVKRKKPKREKAKADPKLIAAAREFRDRALEYINSGQTAIESFGKYDVTRQFAGPSASILAPGGVEGIPKSLPHAA